MTRTEQRNQHDHELHSKNGVGTLATTPCSGDRGRVSVVDGALFVRLCQVHLGVGRHSLEGCRPATSLRDLSAVRPVLLAHGVARATGDTTASHDLTLMIQPV